MPKASRPGYYAVRIGRVPGIYHSWADCEAQVKGFMGAMYKKLGTEAEAIEFMAARPGVARIPTSRDAVSTASTSRVTVASEASAPTRGVGVAYPTAEDEEDCDIVYCDGACRGNGKIGSIAGIGVWWGHGDTRNISERCPGDQTNNRAELIAIIRILETTPRLKRRLLIKTDSSYSIQCVTSWIFKWMSNGFLAADGKPVKNRTLIKYLAALLHVRCKTSQTVKFKHVRGHVGIEGNEAADQLANLGTIKPAVPERDWEKLEREVLSGPKPVEVVGDNLKVYAGSLSNDGEPSGLADTTIGAAVLPAQVPNLQHLGDKKNATRCLGSTSLVPLEVPPLHAYAAGLNGARSGDATTAMRSESKLLSRAPPGPTTPAALCSLSTPSKKLTSAPNKEELEIYAPCLLGDDELSTLGKDGVFDSDF